MTIEINGIAHIILTVRDIPASRLLYDPLLEHLGLTRVADDEQFLYYVGGRTAVGLRPAAAQFTDEHFDQGRPGLHHVCFRARSRQDVDSVHELVAKLGAAVVHPPQEDAFVPGYYSLLFEDRDGIRLEVNHVPGRGVFEPGVERVDPTGFEPQ
ncbi:MAG: VOC family protein [Myxococcales bacterium]|nr:VOC family protein [Myxococcales bacterium]